MRRDELEDLALDFLSKYRGQRSVKTSTEFREKTVVKCLICENTLMIDSVSISSGPTSSNRVIRVNLHECPEAEDPQVENAK